MCDNWSLIWLMRPVPPREWAGPGPRFTVVRMENITQDRIRATLEQFWGGHEETVRVPRKTLDRVKGAARAALLQGLTAGVKKELEWAAGL